MTWNRVASGQRAFELVRLMKGVLFILTLSALLGAYKIPGPISISVPNFLELLTYSLTLSFVLLGASLPTRLFTPALLLTLLITLNIIASFYALNKPAHLGQLPAFTGCCIMLLAYLFWLRSFETFVLIRRALLLIGFLAVGGAFLQGVVGVKAIFPEATEVGRLERLGLGFFIPRSMGFFVSRGLYGSYVEVASFIAMSSIFGQARALGMPRYLWFLAPVLAFSGVMLSQSRGGILATVAGFLVFACLSAFYIRGWRRAVLISGLTCFATVVVILIPLLMRLWEALVAVDEASMTNRLENFSLALELIRRNPLIGNGFFAVEKLFNTDHIVHNCFLMIFVALGIGGLVVFLSLFVIAIVSGLRCIRHGNPRAPFAIGLLAGLAALVVELNLYNGNTAPVNYVVLALLMALPYIPFPMIAPTSEPRTQRPGQSSFSAVELQSLQNRL